MMNGDQELKEFREEILHRTPEEIRGLRSKLWEIEESIEKCKYGMEKWETSVKQEIYNATNEEGKKQFSNQEQRKTELSRRKEVSKSYKGMEVQLQKLKEQREETKAELEYHRRRFRALETIGQVESRRV